MKILGDHVAHVEHAGHLLAVPGVTLHQGVIGHKAGFSDGHGQLFMVGLLARDDWAVCDKGVVDPVVGDQVGLELVQVHGEDTAAGF